MSDLLEGDLDISEQSTPQIYRIDIAKVDKVAYSVAQEVSEELGRPLKSFGEQDLNGANVGIQLLIEKSDIELNSREMKEAVRRVRGRLLETEIDGIALSKGSRNSKKPSSTPGDISEMLKMNYNR